MPRQPRYDPFGDVGSAQEYLREGVEGYGEQLRPHLMREIGNALGGLNSVGALRSGGTTVALRDISSDYAERIGSYAKQASGAALDAGLEARRLRDQDEERRRARRASIGRAVGGLLGAGVGFFLGGGPAGAAAGARIGSSVGR